MAEHTKGPWEFKEEGGYPQSVFAYRIEGPEGTAISPNGGIVIAYLGHGKALGEAEANARLIAAAPLMLAALGACQCYVAPHTPFARKLKEIIKKATEG